MASFTDPVADANEAQEAVRGLAHATRDITEPDATYRILGSLSATLWSLRQALDQLAVWHEQNATRAAADDGNRKARQGVAHQAADHLRFAAAMAARAGAHVDQASNRNGRLVWAPDPQAQRPLFAPTDTRTPARAHRNDLDR